MCNQSVTKKDMTICSACQSDGLFFYKKPIVLAQNELQSDFVQKSSGPARIRDQPNAA